MGSSIYSSYVVNPQGEVLLHSSPNWIGKNISSHNQFRDVLANSFTSGVLESKGSDGEALLVSFKKNQWGGLRTISQLSKVKAFLVTNRFIEKSVFFAILIFSFVFIVSLLFTKGLTRALTH